MAKRKSRARARSLDVGNVYPQARFPTGEFIPFTPRCPDCWRECLGQKISALKFPELAEAFRAHDLPVTKNVTLPDLGKGMWMLVRPLPPETE